MKLRTKRFLLAIIVGTIVYILLGFSRELPFQSLTPFWIAVLFGSYCLWILLIYFLTGLRKNEEYLRKVEKWDSPKRLVLMLIPLWIVCAVLYYMNPYRWIFYYGIAFSLVYLHGAYLRNIYRRELKT
jgi:multisubunit Na+/H+ antiporter MnhB subunit